MKADIPIRPAQFFEAAEKHGLRIIRGVSTQRLTVASLERDGPVLRFFAPILRTLPDGTEVNGSIGVGLMDIEGRYDEVLFHHILNVTELREADRLIRQDDDWSAFFRVLVPALEGLPSTPNELVEALADSKSWIGKQMSWDDSNSKSFARRLQEIPLR